MISLHDFDKAIRFIEERDNGIEKINKVFTEEFEDSVFYPYFKYEAAFVDLLIAAVSDNTMQERTLNISCMNLITGITGNPV